MDPKPTLAQLDARDRSQRTIYRVPTKGGPARPRRYVVYVRKEAA